MGIVLGFKGEVTDSFHQPFGKFLWYVFSLISFCSCFLGWWILTSSENLIIISPFIKVEEILCGFLPIFRGFFHIIFGVLFCG